MEFDRLKDRNVECDRDGCQRLIDGLVWKADGEGLYILLTSIDL